MLHKSRLRIHKSKRGRRAIAYSVGFVLILVAVYKLDNHYKISSSLLTFYNSQKTNSRFNPARGTIFDRNLNPLAVTLQRISVYARTREISSVPQSVSQLSSILDIEKEDLIEKLTGDSLRVWLAEGISEEQEKLLKEKNLPGIYFQQNAKRYYPNGPRAGHVVGYVEDNIGLAGVELYYDRLLTENKKSGTLRDSLQLVLTIDMQIQEEIDSLLAEVMNAQQVDTASAYLINGYSGEILASSRIPEFNPNIFTKYSKQEQESTFYNPLVVPTKFRMFFRDIAMLVASNENSKRSLPWSIARSTNNFGVQLRLWDEIGLNNQLESDFYFSQQKKGRKDANYKPVAHVGESYALVPDFVTPMNLLTALSVLIDGNRELQPFVVKKVIDKKDGEDVQRKKSVTFSSLFDESVVVGGEEGRRFFETIARKDSSGIKILRDRGVFFSGGERDGSLSMVENDVTFAAIPIGEYHLNLLIIGQKNPTRVAFKKKKRIAIEKAVANTGKKIAIMHQVAENVADELEPKKIQKKNFQSTIFFTEDNAQKNNGVFSEAQEFVMPDLVGLSLRKSFRLLRGSRVQISFHGTGRVVSQKPKAGTILKRGEQCFLVLESEDKMSFETMSVEN